MSSDPFLAPSPSRMTRKSTASLRGTNGDASTGGGGSHSLAHELAHALMPEPSASSRLLAEELGIEYDEGAEGIDESNTSGLVDDSMNMSMSASMMGGQELEMDPTFGDAAGPESPTRRVPEKKKDALEQLAEDLQSTEAFLTLLKTADDHGQDSGKTASKVESLAGTILSTLSETVVSREEQVRELIALEREFRKIGSEVNGTEVLGQLDTLISTAEDEDEELYEPPASPRHQRILSASSMNSDYRQDIYSDDEDVAPIPPPPPVVGPPTPATLPPQLSHLRSTTKSLITSLTSLSEHAQINSTSTTDAGRKIRALRNKLGEWRGEHEQTEAAISKIEIWEKEWVRGQAKRMMDEEMGGFKESLEQAGAKTQAIMASS